MSENRVFVIYECADGWCFEKAYVDSDGWVRRWAATKHRPVNLHAYSRLSQLVWHLTRMVTNDNASEEL